MTLIYKLRKSAGTINNKLQTYDKATHFIIGVCAGVAGVDKDLFIGLITAKEVVDCYKRTPTGFGVEDWLAGLGGYYLGLYFSKLFKLL